MANDDLKAIFDNAMESVVSEWLEKGLSENEIEERMTVERIYESMQAIMKKSSELSFDFFKNHMYEIA